MRDSELTKQEIFEVLMTCPDFDGVVTGLTGIQTHVRIKNGLVASRIIYPKDMAEPDSYMEWFCIPNHGGYWPVQYHHLKLAEDRKRKWLQAERELRSIESGRNPELEVYEYQCAHGMMPNPYLIAKFGKPDLLWQTIN